MAREGKYDSPDCARLDASYKALLRARDERIRELETTILWHEELAGDRADELDEAVRSRDERITQLETALRDADAALDAIERVPILLTYEWWDEHKTLAKVRRRKGVLLNTSEDTP